MRNFDVFDVAVCLYGKCIKGTYVVDRYSEIETGL